MPNVNKNNANIDIDLDEVKVDEGNYQSDDSAFGDAPKHYTRREEQVTEFITTIVDNYKRRWNAKQAYQHIITIMLLSFVTGFAICLIVLIFISLCNNDSDIGKIITLLSTIGVSFIASIFSLLHVVTKYIFPSEEERHSIEVLKSTLEIDYRYYASKVGIKDNNLDNKDNKN